MPGGRFVPVGAQVQMGVRAEMLPLTPQGLGKGLNLPLPQWRQCQPHNGHTPPMATAQSTSPLRQWAAAIRLKIIPERVLRWPWAPRGAGSVPCQGSLGTLSQPGVCGSLWWHCHPRVCPCHPARAAHCLCPSSRDAVAVPRCQSRVPSTLSTGGVTVLGPRVPG